MALPKINTPTYELTLPLSKKQVTYRPFLVKEQKILMMANEANDRETIIRAIKQILHNCTLNDVKVDHLPILDIEYYFLNLRARSVGEVVELRYKCENIVEDEICGKGLDVSFNLLELEIQNVEQYNDVIMLDKNIGIKIKYPDFSLFEKIKEDDSITDLTLEIILSSIDYIFDGDEFFYAKETPREELLEFLDSLSQNQFTKIEEFFKNIPVIKKDVDIKCPKCGFDHKIHIEGIDNFFT